ncbi:MAG: tRNA pseudouridine(55) synthase TruB [Clostridia bacterium]|nr:tRNA pseudouridine(55) synthase TruB [Clostridia bacterium]
MTNPEPSGILNILKPPGMTSFDVIGYLRRLLKTKKIGHAGTLDPAAVGVLPVFLGQATKAIEFMMEKDKVYRAELTLGISTDTQDNTGRVVSERKVNVTEDELCKAFKSFLGEQEQLPPMYSAVRVDGKKLYELAREGKIIDRKSRCVRIYSINIVHVIRSEDKIKKVIFDVHCSKGTYIRTLCHDLGEKLGCGGHMSFLIRLKAGEYDIADALTIENIEKLTESGLIREKLLSPESAFSNLAGIKLNDYEVKRFLNGVMIEADKALYKHGELLRVYDSNGLFIAVAQVNLCRNSVMLKSRKLFL